MPIREMADLRAPADKYENDKLLMDLQEQQTMELTDRQCIDMKTVG